jgi:hypothetical protein
MIIDEMITGGWIEYTWTQAMEYAFERAATYYPRYRYRVRRNLDVWVVEEMSND